MLENRALDIQLALFEGPQGCSEHLAWYKKEN